MADARRRWFDLLVGLAVGSVLSGAWVSWKWQKTFQTMYVVETADQANVAREIAAGRGAALAERIRASLPGYALGLEREFRGVAGKDWALWAVRDAFEAAGVAPPEEIATQLRALPPREASPPPEGVRAAAGDGPGGAAR
jgi:hypothetical protein